MSRCSRRQFLWGSAAAAAAHSLSRSARAQGVSPYSGQPSVSLVSGDDRRKNIRDALAAIDDEILPVLRTKKSVLIKPNLVQSASSLQWWGNVNLSCTKADAVRGVLDYLAPRFSGPVVIAEASADDTTQAFADYGYTGMVRESDFSHFESLSLIDLSAEGRYVLHPVVDKDLHVQPVRAAARLFDPEAFIISAAVMKTHDRVVATMSVKNMAMGAPLLAKKSETWWSDKPKMHDTHRLANVNIFQMAQRLKQYWGVAVIDGFEGMEGNGPCQGTGVASRVAIASTDFVAADRVGIECMGINPDWVGYLNYAWRLGLGQFDLSKITVAGADPQAVKKSYRLHDLVLQELQWTQPFPACNTNEGRPPSNWAPVSR